MLRSVLLQLGAGLVATAIAAVFFGPRGAISAAYGAFACIVPAAMFALRLGALARRSGATVTAFVVGEFVKIASIVGLLVLFPALYPGVHWGALLIGLILALKANLFAFLVRN